MIEPDERARTEFSVGEILRRWGPAYSQTHPMPLHQRRAMADLAACRTAALGGHIEACEKCGHEHPAYNSCGNRHCPLCQGKKMRKWLRDRLGDLLPVSYFHTVLTLPESFNALVPGNEKALYNALFKAGSGALKALARKHWQADIGIVAVLHTWGQQLWLHPHLHCIVTGGGLSEDEQRWVSWSQDFLFDVHELSHEFRKRFCKLLRRAKLQFNDSTRELAEPARWRAFLKAQEGREWVVYCQKPVAGAEKVLSYLSRYTHRVAISNRRLEDVADDGTITLRYKDYADKDGSGEPKPKLLRLSAVDFIGRLMRHVLPAGFRKIRCYGILAGNQKKRKLAACRAALSASVPDVESLLEALQIDVKEVCCERCGHQVLTVIGDIPAQRGPPVVCAMSEARQHAAA